MRRAMGMTAVAVLTGVLLACGSLPTTKPPSPTPPDAGASDAGPTEPPVPARDAGDERPDGGETDAGDAGGAPPDAGPVWADLGDVSSGPGTLDSEHEPQVAVAENGTIVVAWQQWLPSAGYITLGYRFSQDKGATWTDRALLPLQPGTNVMANGRVVALPDGGFQLVWVALKRTSTGRSNIHVWAARAAAGSTSFGTPVEVSVPTEQVGIHDLPAVAVTPSGTVHVAWAKASLDHTKVVIAHAWSTDGTTWQRQEAVGSGSEGSFRNGVELCADDASEDVYAVWFDTDHGIALARQHGNQWSTPLEVSLEAEAPQLALMSSACAVVGSRVWVMYGLGETATSSKVPLWSHIQLAQSEDLGASISKRASAEGAFPQTVFLSPKLGRAADKSLHLVTYASAGAGVKGVVTWARSLDGLSFPTRLELLQDMPLEQRRGVDAWMGDYLGFGSASWGSVAGVVDNRSGKAHVKLLRYSRP